MIQLSIMSAEAKRMEQKIFQQKIEAERPARVEKLVGQVFNFVKNKIEEEKKYNFCEVLITDNEIFLWEPRNSDELREAIANVTTLFRCAGYEMRDFYEYSDSYKARKKAFGYFYISWSE